MLSKFLKQRKAKKFGIQYEYKGFWPHFYWVMRDGVCDGCELVSPMFRPSSPSNVYPILVSKTHMHCYELISKQKMPGDDWAGASPYGYDLRYHHSELRTDAGGGEDG